MPLRHLLLRTAITVARAPMDAVHERCRPVNSDTEQTTKRRDGARAVETNEKR